MLACGKAPAGGHAANTPLHHTAMQRKGPLLQHSELEQWSSRCDVIPEVARDSTNVFTMRRRLRRTACDQGMPRRSQAVIFNERQTVG